MREVKQFVTSDVDQLSTQLSKFEDNVVKETSGIRSTFMPIPKPTAPILAAGSVCTVGQAALCDTRAGAFELNLAPPVNKQPGWLYVIHSNGGANLTLRPVAPGLINNLASAVSSVVVASVFFDGAVWWF